MGRTTTYGYDELGRILSVINAKSETTKYGYDFQNNLTRQVYPDGRAAAMEYSPVGQLLKDTDIYGKSQYLAYSLDGTVQKMLDRSAQTQNYTYDTKLRVATQTGPDHTYIYHYLANDRIDYVEDTVNGTLRYAYDSDGRLQQKTFPDGKTMEYGYDNAGNLTSQKDPFGLTVTYGYNNQNQISTLTAEGKTFRYDYYADGLMKTLTYPVAGLKADYSFDQLNRITGVQNTLNGSSIAGYTCSYDLNGNLTGSATPGLTRSFSYDTLNRLTQADRTEPNSHTGFTYDVLSNRAGASGNIEYLIPTQLGQLTWDSLNRLKSFKDITTDQTTAYKYDYKGLRTQKVNAAGTTNYYTNEAGRVIAEADSTGAAKAQIIWSNKPLARIVGGVWYYYVYNDHGDVVKLVDESGTAVNSYSYDEWGNLTEKTEAVENPIRYAGEYQDEESGYYYLRARYYDPVTSRFISKDSKPGTLENPLSQNLYTYCMNSPLVYTDPSGHSYQFINVPGMNFSGIRDAVGQEVKAWEDNTRQGIIALRDAYIDGAVMVATDGLVQIVGNKIAIFAKNGIKTISIKAYEKICEAGTHNADAMKVMLGKFDGGGATSYIKKAGKDHTFFSLGDDWDKICKKYGFTNNEMFSLFNEPFLDDGINSGKTFYFSHDPEKFGGMLKMELDYLLENGYRYLKEGGLMYAIPN